MGTHNVHRAAELLHEAGAAGPITEILEAAVLDDHAMFPSALPAVRETSYNAWVTIQIGCDNSCAFCIVPAVRGVEITRPFDEIVGEVSELAAAGVTEVTLLGQNVNSYGRDLQLAARRAGDRRRPGAPAVRRPAARPSAPSTGIRRVRFTSPHPKDMRPETFAAMAETPAVCPQLHYPLQAGSDRVLAAMHRGYTAERYLARLAEARRVVPDLAVSTDIIVGFPGETDDDFARHAGRRRRGRFDDAFTFIFSPRPGTEAADAGRSLRRPGGRRRALRPAARRHRAQLAGRQPGPHRAHRGGARRGPEQEGPRPCSRPARRSTGSSTSARRAAAGGDVRHRRDHRRRAAPPRRASFVERARRADAPHAHPRRRALT